MGASFEFNSESDKTVTSRCKFMQIYQNKFCYLFLNTILYLYVYACKHKNIYVCTVSCKKDSTNSL